MGEAARARGGGLGAHLVRRRWLRRNRRVRERGLGLEGGRYINMLGVGPVEMGHTEIMVRDAFFVVRFDRGTRQRFLFAVRRFENARQRYFLSCVLKKTHDKLVFYNFIKFRKIVK
jgi:hypothetical protein